MKLLNQSQITQKIKRLAYEILEQNFDANQIILAGINNNGMIFANLLFEQLTTLSKTKFILTRISLNPANPIEKEVDIELPLKDLKNKVIIIVDDVANTGRTIFYACKPLFKVVPKKVEVAVLVDRKHKSFPIK